MKSLKTILLIDALSCAATGLLLLFLADSVAALFQVSSSAVFTEVGLFLLLFAGFVLYVSRQNPRSARLVRLVIAANSLWVVASIVVLLWPGLHLSAIGQGLVVAVAGWVALMAYLQTNSLRQQAA